MRLINQQLASPRELPKPTPTVTVSSCQFKAKNQLAIFEINKKNV